MTKLRPSEQRPGLRSCGRPCWCWARPVDRQRSRPAAGPSARASGSRRRGRARRTPYRRRARFVERRDGRPLATQCGPSGAARTVTAPGAASTWHGVAEGLSLPHRGGRQRRVRGVEQAADGEAGQRRDRPRQQAERDERGSPADHGKAIIGHSGSRRVQAVRLAYHGADPGGRPELRQQPGPTAEGVDDVGRQGHLDRPVEQEEHQGQREEPQQQRRASGDHAKPLPPFRPSPPLPPADVGACLPAVRCRPAGGGQRREGGGVGAKFTERLVRVTMSPASSGRTISAAMSKLDSSALTAGQSRQRRGQQDRADGA